MASRKKNKDKLEIELAIQQKKQKKKAGKNKKIAEVPSESLEQEVIEGQESVEEAPVEETMEEELKKSELEGGGIPYAKDKSAVYPELKQEGPEYEAKEEPRKKEGGAPPEMEDAATEAKAKIQDWYLGLPKKGSPDRKRKKKLI
jgi:hypothetical protein